MAGSPTTARFELRIKPTSLIDLTVIANATDSYFTQTLNISDFIIENDYLVWTFAPRWGEQSISTYDISSTGYISQNNIEAKHTSSTIIIDDITSSPSINEYNLVILEPEIIKPTFTFTISPTPSDATVKINGTEQSSITVDEGTVVNYKVYKDGYETISGEYTVTSDYTLSVLLTPEKDKISEIEIGDRTFVLKDKRGYTKTIFDYLLQQIKTEYDNLPKQL